MNDFTVTRWKRYGHDRAYVSDASGTKLGYVDLSTSEVIIEQAANADAVRRAVAVWSAAEGVSTPATPDVAEPAAAEALPTEALETASAGAEPTPEPPVQQWVDLAEHRPGEGVRQLANEEWAAAKERSKVFSIANRYVFDNHTQERAWRKGAEGEEFVGMKLNRLRDRGWRVLHSVPVGKGDSDIDHIVIGPGGVFTVNSKMHAGKKIWVAKYQMRVNGQPVPYLRNSRHEAGRAKKLLEAQLDFDVPVVGCVVVLTGSLVPEVTYKQMPDDVRVLDKWDVPRWFKKRPAVLSPEQVEAIFSVARRSTTWR
ncbi:nuclease-related domain-containing protein [Demequina aestuarii]|uniref:nuclease-related domain-containing protein n=1 Tax=Demequina aestuarii TaxID=327095 RepID=UPI000AC98A51|nr:nuclease-related domain-containing protein [Demequina aestuarii]